MRTTSTPSPTRRGRSRRYQPCRYEQLEVRRLLAASLALVQATPAAGAMGVSAGADLAVRFDRALDPSSVGAGAFVLRDPRGDVVPATVSWDTGAGTLRLVPSVALDGMETFLATLRGGAGGPKGLDGTALPADRTWSFTTGDFANPPGPLGPGVLINRADGLITDAAGGTARFAVRLAAAPGAPVTVPLHTGDAAVATVSATALTFTAANWDVPQTVTVSGVVAPSATATVAYRVFTDPAVSADRSYNGYDAADVQLTNQPVNTRAALEASSAGEAQRFAYDEANGPGMGMGMGAGHDPLSALVPVGVATHRAIASGNWSDPATWAGGVAPADGADVWVMPGRAVTVDGAVAAGLHTVRVSGTLAFATDRTTALRVDTIVVDPAGTFTVGTTAAPVAAGVTATVTFTDSGAIDREWDPYGYSRGLISRGAASIVGAAKAGSTTLAVTPKAGDTRLVLTTAPANWAVGDVIDLPGTSGNADRRFRLTAVSADGKTLTLDAPVTYDMAAPPTAAGALSVADLTRNVVFTSANGQDVTRRGHVMFMQNPNVTVEYAAFHALGRTDFSKAIDNATVGPDGMLMPGTGTNPKGRYSVHFHVIGTDPTKGQALVLGSVVDDATGWGFVNHSSNVAFRDDVAVQTGDAGFVSESGDEIGSFVNDLAVGGGHVGFWLNGPGVQVVNNVASGFLTNYGEGFMAWTYTTFRADGSPVYFRAVNLGPGGSAAVDPLAPAGMLRAEVVPFHLVGNRTYNSWGGIEIRAHQGDLGPAFRSTVEGGAVWGVSRGLTFNYSTDVTIRGVAFYGNGQFDSSGVYGDLGPRDLVFDNVTLADWGTGITMPPASSTTVTGGFYNNTIDFHIQEIDPGSATLTGQRVITISGVTYGRSLLPSLLIPSPNDRHYHVYLDNTPIDGGRGLKRFLPGQITDNGVRLYFNDQAADFIVSGTGIPAYDGKTNSELWGSFGIATGGELLPSGTSSDPLLFGGRVGASAAANDKPTAAGASLTLTDSGDAAAPLSGSDPETPASGLVFTLTTLPGLGTLYRPNGTAAQVGDTFTGSPAALSYRLPAVTFGAASASFQYTVTDSGGLTSDPATVTLTTPANSAGVVRVSGTAGADTVVLGATPDGQKLQVTLNGAVVSNTVPLASITQVRAFGREGNDTVTVNGLSLGVALNGGTGTDTVAVTRDANFTLSNTALTVSPAGGPSQTLTLTGVEAANLTGGASANTFTLTGWTGGGSLTGGGGTDIVALRQDADFALSNTQLTVTGGPTVALSGVTRAYLTGGALANAFTLTGWTGNGTLTGGGGTDSLNYALDGNVVLVDNLVRAASGMQMNLVGVTRANLIGGASANTFTLTGWTGGGSLTGGGGTDIVAVTRDADFALSNTQLAVTGGPTVALSGVTRAYLTGGASGNAFTLTGWTGNGTLTGGGGTDTLNLTLDGNVNLANSLVSASSGMQMNLVSVTRANLTGGASANTFNLTGWTGGGSLTGGGGTDTVAATFDASASLTDAQLAVNGGATVALSGIGKAALTLNNAASARVIDASGFSGASVLTASGAAAARLVGGTGNDTLSATGTGPAVLLGGAGNDSLSATGVGRAVLIGGAGADTIKGNGNALQVSGGTTYDGDPAALDAILSEWASSSTYVERINHLLNGGGLNGSTTLTGSTVLNDLAVNAQSNPSANTGDWFVVNANNTVTKKPGETKTTFLQ